MTKMGKRLKYQHDDEKPVTISMRLPKELHTRLERYATQHRQSISELMRDGIEWRIGEGDPRGLGERARTNSPQEYYGNTDREQGAREAEALQEVRTLLRQQWEQIQTLAQALERQRVLPGDGVYSSNTENAPSVVQDVMVPMVKVDKEEVIVRIQQMRDKGLDSAQRTKALQAEGVPTLSGEAQLQAVVDMLEHSAIQDGSEGDTSNTENVPGEHGVVQGSVKGNTSITSVDGDIPAASMEAQSALGQTPAEEDTREGIPPYDPAKRVLGKLCPRGHDYHGTGQSLRKNNRSRTCCACDAEQKRERRQAKRQEVSA